MVLLGIIGFQSKSTAYLVSHYSQWSGTLKLFILYSLEHSSLIKQGPNFCGKIDPPQDSCMPGGYIRSCLHR